jgi:hypothetical protein
MGERISLRNCKPLEDGQDKRLRGVALYRHFHGKHAMERRSILGARGRNLCLMQVTDRVITDGSSSR